jgi:hypothetical protein
MKVKADEIVASFGENATKEKFDAAAKEHSEDTVVDYENIVKGNLDTKIDSWLFDDARKNGDITIIENGSMVHILYYQGEGLETWQQNAQNAIKSDYCTSLTKDREAEIVKAADSNALNNIEI